MVAGIIVALLLSTTLLVALKLLSLLLLLAGMQKTERARLASKSKEVSWDFHHPRTSIIFVYCITNVLLYFVHNGV